MQMSSTRHRIAAVLAATAGLGFGLPCIPAIRYFAENHQVWSFLGFPTYGEGPFEAVGLDTDLPLLTAFLGVCAAEVSVAVLLWRERPSAQRLAVTLLPVELLFWVGFALPLGPPLGLARVAVLVPDLIARRRVRRWSS